MERLVRRWDGGFERTDWVFKAAQVRYYELFSEVINRYSRLRLMSVTRITCSHLVDGSVRRPLMGDDREDDL